MEGIDFGARVHFEMVPYVMNEFKVNMDDAIVMSDNILELVRIRLVERGETERILFGAFAGVQAWRTMWVGIIDNLTFTYQPEDNPYEEPYDDSRIKQWQEHKDFLIALTTGELWK